MTDTPARAGDDTLLPRDHGRMPPWQVAELPAPPPFGLRNVLKVIGPGAIMAATSIGGGEWLVGPAAAVKYSSSIFLIATVAILLQVLFNLEAIRYTLYTGEPIFGGIMRLRPGPKFWAVFYSFLGFFQLGWPALAGSAAATLLGAWMGRMPGAPDQATQAWVATVLIFCVVLILSFGGTIERMLEYFAWTMLAVVFLFLLTVNLMFVPLAHWWQTFTGFFSLSGLSHPIDWGLIGALAATAGSGGLGNLTVTNWVRDKGFGMGSLVGSIPSAVGGHAIALSHVGSVFPTTPANLGRWREWMRYVHADQLWVWGLFCFLGMFLNVNLATAIVPQGTDLQGLAAGAYQAEYLQKIWPGFWFLTLFNGFWILFKTQLGNTDILVRTITDVAWMASPRARLSKRGIRPIYYGILIAFSIWGAFVIRSASPFQLFRVLANMAGVVLAIAGVQVFIVNRYFLPRAVQPALWRQIGLLLCSAFYAFFAFFVIRELIRTYFRDPPDFTQRRCARDSPEPGEAASVAINATVGDLARCRFFNRLVEARCQHGRTASARSLRPALRADDARLGVLRRRPRPVRQEACVADQSYSDLEQRVSALEAKVQDEATAVEQHFAELQKFITFSFARQARRLNDLNRDVGRLEVKVDANHQAVMVILRDILRRLPDPPVQV